jgi:hypothetical protein
MVKGKSFLASNKEFWVRILVEAIAYQATNVIEGRRLLPAGGTSRPLDGVCGVAVLHVWL